MEKSGSKTSQAIKDKCRLITPEFRVSFPHVFKPSAMKGAKPKYSIVMLFNKKQDLTPIKDAIRNAKIAAFGSNQKDWPKDLMSPVTDGDSVKLSKHEGYKGHWAIKASSMEENRPGVVNEEVEEIVNPADFYPGCFARAQVFARVWEFGGKQGIHFILDHVQKTKDGKSLTSRKSASEVFNPISDLDEDDDSSFSEEEDGDEEETHGFK